MTATDYRKKAQEIRDRAEQSQDPEVRREWLAVANQYDQLAEAVERRRIS